MKKTVLKKYACLIAKKGVNIQKGQDVVIRCDLDQIDFVYILTDECYKLGARKVEVEWDSQRLTKSHVKYRDLNTLSTVEKWEEEKLKFRSEKLPCMIYLLSEDPDGLNGIDRNKYAASIQNRYKIIKPYRDAMENKYQWCIAAVPGKAWAKKIFPDLKINQAVEKLWDAILYTSRADGDNPIEAWNDHNETLKKRCDYLNSKKITTLEYSSKNGTKLSVGLIPGSRFMGGSEDTLSGIEFNPNIPSEEIFITPMRGKAEGIVKSSKPLSYRGELIENFEVVFKDGKVESVKAEKNEELLKQLVSMDEGASYLGECALVPYDSPIRNSEITFFNTLFDENAACHLAFGEGFSNCLEGFENMSLEQCRERGINESMVHEDFMIGTADLDIVGICEDGQKIQIFKNGNFAF